MLVVLAFIGIIDLIWQRYDFMKSLRMSHQDIKDEYKETDGQPEVKQKIRKLQAEQQINLEKKTLQLIIWVRLLQLLLTQHILLLH